jgi:hypothetical protein
MSERMPSDSPHAAGAASMDAAGGDLAYDNILLTGENGMIKSLADRQVTVRGEGAGTLPGSAADLRQEEITKKPSQPHR